MTDALAAYQSESKRPNRDRSSSLSQVEYAVRLMQMLFRPNLHFQNVFRNELLYNIISFLCHSKT